METRTAKIADGIFRLSTHVPDIAPPDGFTFNQFLILAKEPLLFHCGPRAMFPLVSAAASEILPLEQLRWISFGHIEADECGAMNLWLEAAPQAQVVYSELGCQISVNDLSDRSPRTLAQDEVLDLGGKRVRIIATPHVPTDGKLRSFMKRQPRRSFAATYSPTSATESPSPCRAS